MECKNILRSEIENRVTSDKRYNLIHYALSMGRNTRKANISFRFKSILNRRKARFPNKVPGQ